MRNSETPIILKALLDELRCLPVVKGGDYTVFEDLAFKVNNFRGRLIEMSLRDEVENSYILQELEKIYTSGSNR